MRDQIDLAKRLLESKGYTVRLSESHSTSEFSKLLKIYDRGGNSAGHIESLVLKYQPDAGSLNDLTEENAKKVYNDLVDKYTRELDRYGDDAEIDTIALKILKLQ